MNKQVNILCVSNRKAVQEPFLTRIETLLKGNVYAFILREKDLDRKDFKKLATDVHALCFKYQTPFFLNANFSHFLEHTIFLANELSCGLHTSFTNYEQAIEKNIFNNFSLNIPLGISIHSLQEAEFIKNNYIKLPVNHIIAGHIFETNCKEGTKGRGLVFLESITKCLAEIPKIAVFAIGGMTPKKAPEVLKTGAYGVAVMSSLMESNNPLQLLAEFEKSLKT